MRNENLKDRGLGTRTNAAELQVPAIEGDRRVDGSWDLSIWRLGC